MTIYINKNFCVYLTFYSGSKLPPYYIGSTSIYKINKGYKGSVTSRKYKILWEEELLNNPHLFKTNIISYHETRKEALNKELKLHKLLNVVKSSMYINQSLASPNGFFGMSSLGIKNSNKHNYNISKAKLGIPRPKEVIEKMSNTRKSKKLH